MGWRIEYRRLALEIEKLGLEIAEPVYTQPAKTKLNYYEKKALEKCKDFGKSIAKRLKKGNIVSQVVFFSRAHSLALKE